MEPRTRLVRLEDRTPWLYVEYAVVGRHEDQLTLVRESGTLIVPSGTLGAILLGPGTSVTHPGMCLLSENCVSLLWVRGGGLGMVHASHPPAFSRSSSLASAQALVVSDPQRRLSAARAMYRVRFREELEGGSLQELQLAEGRRVKEMYAAEARRCGIPWSGRGPGRGADSVNRILDTAYHCVYGACEVAVAAGGMSPALGVIHNGHARSFVFDIADLFKDQAATLAFELASEGVTEASEVRSRVRDWAWSLPLISSALDAAREVVGASGPAVDVSDTSSWWDGAA